ncbi:recombinase family protein [Actinoplanes sp. NEAU-A12]|uniref:Recombinase family protein n=1 Tax=Actinoplanes sandaracinus TaxID=3045177 RepID=A0ABT6WY57_9ACTN|nr:recombinase family protein [Actinoplanes sandaracinus]MDI6104678.1 recombinase family protein [Actinoplanes sandaracinus]
MTPPAEALDLLSAWLVSPPAARVRGRTGPPPTGSLRFAFYGRMSTVEYQDDLSSRAWQHDSAARLIAGHGVIVASFFDVGCSRSLPWEQRPQAAALLAAIADPHRRFDAIVIGEFERAFSAGQFEELMPFFAAHGIQVWLPEAGGPIDPDDPVHQALVLMLGHQSHREILRSRFRTTAAMLAQARDQGRHLGGRPPYGYRLVDAGPHPNAAHARWGRRLHRLDPDPETAPTVRWMFAQRLAGCSVAGIARTLNANGVASPSAHDRARNPHRSGAAWTVRTVAAILENPRYTGRQVWNRQGIDHHETRPGDKNSRPPGRKPSHRWNRRDQWVISTAVVHPPLVSEPDFLRAQQVSALEVPDDGSQHRYRLTGLLICGLCGRRMEGQWVHGRAGYRCRHGYTSGSDAQPDRAKTLYVREDHAFAQAVIQYANFARLEPETLGPAEFAGRLRQEKITVMCTPVSITLDTGASPAKPEPSAAVQGADLGQPLVEVGAAAGERCPGRPVAVQLSLPGVVIPHQRQTAFNPHQGHPKRERPWWGLTCPNRLYLPRKTAGDRTRDVTIGVRRWCGHVLGFDMPEVAILGRQSLLQPDRGGL